MKSLRRPGGLKKFCATDREQCGVIVQNDRAVYVLEVPNRAEKDDEYVIMEADVNIIMETLTEDEKVVGFFHTHLPHHKCEPSDSDFDGAELHPEYEYLIYKPDTDELCWYGAEVAMK